MKNAFAKNNVFTRRFAHIEQIRPIFHELNTMQKYGRKDIFIFYTTQFTERKSDDRQ